MMTTDLATQIADTADQLGKAEINLLNAEERVKSEVATRDTHQASVNHLRDSLRRYTQEALEELE